MLVLSTFLLVACGGGDTTEPTTDDTSTSSDTTTDTSTGDTATDDTAMDDKDSGERVQIRWFVGLGAGSDEPMFAPQEQIVADFNASQDDIELVLEIVDADQAAGTLATQIAGGNAPDIVGPVGIKGRDSFRGAWLDLSELIEKNNVDLSDFDPGMVQFYVDRNDQQLGLPFAIFPSYISYNADLFDEAKLPYPPHEYGQPYIDADGNEHEWNMDTLRDLALQLTVDENGNDATSPDFDPDKIVQFGYSEVWTDFRGHATSFGAGSLVDADGNAVMPDHWREAAKWFYDGMWGENTFTPNAIYGSSEVLANGNPFDSGNLAMGHTHLWYAGCCMGNLKANWNMAAMPSYNGVTTAKMHADTFAIMRGTEHPEEAFEVLMYFIDERAADMTEMYGGMPARLSLQGDYFETFGENTFPDQENLNWDVVTASMAYADNPNHESYLPSVLEATDAYNKFWTLLTNEPGLDVDAEIEKLLVDLQAIYDASNE
ncbi:MAG TPA: extracellular solute-binding protein [Anaerolineae bacterium]|nr:extracellular solute-binding protein [Anaerolineae bacterium]